MGKYPLLYRIRRMEPRDIARVVALERQIYEDPWPEGAFVQEIYFNPDACYFVLELFNRPRKSPWRFRNLYPAIHGYVGMRVEKRGGHISTLALRADDRGRGLGELLLITALEQAIAMGAANVLLEVRVSNERAQHLYTKYQFKNTLRLHCYYRNGEDAFLMEVSPLDEAYQMQLQAHRRRVEARVREALVAAAAEARSKTSAGVKEEV